MNIMINLDEPLNLDAHINVNTLVASLHLDVPFPCKSWS